VSKPCHGPDPDWFPVNLLQIHQDVLLLELGPRIMGSRCNTANIHLIAKYFSSALSVIWPTRRRIYYCQCSVSPRSRSWNELITRGFRDPQICCSNSLFFTVHSFVDPSLKRFTLHVNAGEEWSTTHAKSTELCMLHQWRTFTKSTVKKQCLNCMSVYIQIFCCCLPKK
jgi:hypothetical protein